MKVTDRRIYISWVDAMRRKDVPLFENAEDAQDLPSPPITPNSNIDYEVPPWAGEGTTPSQNRRTD